MAILQFKNADGNWESFVDYDLLTQIKAGVDELLERPAGGSCDHHVIETGTYTIKSNPDVSYVGSSGPATNYLYGDIVLYNTTKLKYNYGLWINDGTIKTLTNPVGQVGLLDGATIYSSGAYVDAYSNKYNVPIKTVVSEAFYNWWEANTTKS